MAVAAASETTRQISQMVQFIKQEASEKAEEIRVKTDQEFNIAKLSHIERAKSKIREEFKQMQKEKVTKAKIARSVLVQKARNTRLQKQDDVVLRLKNTALERLAKVSDNAAYEQLLVGLIVQGLVRLREPKVTLRCREADLAVVKRCLPKAEKQYQEVYQRDIGEEHSTSLTISDDFLPPARTQDTPENAFTCAGGIELLALSGKICISNTLDSRLDLCFEELKPSIRKLLFGVQD